MPCIFSLLPGGVNALKISFHFSGAENAVLQLDKMVGDFVEKHMEG